jgi:hypothetical protein
LNHHAAYQQNKQAQPGSQEAPDRTQALKTFEQMPINVFLGLQSKILNLLLTLADSPSET